MSDSEQHKQKQLEILSSYLDGECTRDEQLLAEHWLQSNAALKADFVQMGRVKQAINSLPRAEAPTHLRLAIEAELASEGRVQRKKSAPVWFIAVAAAAVFLLSLQFLSPILFHKEVPPSASVFSPVSLEEHVYTHFKLHEGDFFQPNHSFASADEAAGALQSVYGMDLIVPKLKSAKLIGVHMDDFVDGFKSPLFLYEAPDGNPIYVFGFKMDALMSHKHQVERAQDAVKECQKFEDYHIADINGMHVTSWKWHDNWYAAISNHDGKVLASLLPLD